MANSGTELENDTVMEATRSMSDGTPPGATKWRNKQNVTNRNKKNNNNTYLLLVALAVSR